MCLIMYRQSYPKIIKENLTYNEMMDMIQKDYTLHASFPRFSQEWFYVKYKNEQPKLKAITDTIYSDIPFYKKLKSGGTCKDIKTWFVFRHPCYYNQNGSVKTELSQSEHKL